MKILRHPTLLASLLVAAMTLNASAQLDPSLENTKNYSSGPSQTNQFNTADGYVQDGSSLDFQPTNSPTTWQTTDPYPNPDPYGSTSLVLFATNYTPLTAASGNSSVFYGGYLANDGYLPGITDPSLFYSFTQSGVFANPVFIRSSSFSIDFAIASASASNVAAGFTNKDYFGFNLMDFGGTQSLAQFRFNPFTGPANFLDLEWIQNGTNVVANGISFVPFAIEYDTLYRFTATLTNPVGVGAPLLNVSVSGLVPQGTQQVVPDILDITNYAVVTNANIIINGAVSSGLTLSDFGRVSLDWELSSGNINNPGGNYMIMTASSIITQAVPEPGTWAVGVLLLGGVVVLMARRRAPKAAA